MCRFVDRMQGAHCGNVRSRATTLATHAQESLERADAAWHEFETRLAETEPAARWPAHVRIREEARRLRTAPYART